MVILCWPSMQIQLPPSASDLLTTTFPELCIPFVVIQFCHEYKRWQFHLRASCISPTEYPQMSQHH